MPRVLRALWSLFWTLLCLALIAAGIASLYNITRDDLDIERRVEAEACGGEGEGCDLQRIYVQRGALSETFEFYDARRERQETIRVRCTHEHVFVGADVCEVRDRRPSLGARVTPPSRPTTKGNAGVPRPLPARPAGTVPPTVEHDGGSAR